MSHANPAEIPVPSLEAALNLAITLRNQQTDRLEIEVTDPKTNRDYVVTIAEVPGDKSLGLAGRVSRGDVVRHFTKKGPVVIGVTEQFQPHTTASDRERLKYSARERRNPPGFIVGYRFHPKTGVPMANGRIHRYRAYPTDRVEQLGQWSNPEPDTPPPPSPPSSLPDTSPPDAPI